GSTSGIGLGIVRALAAEGANVLLNGFGDRGEIEALRTRLAAELGVKVLFSGADASKPDEIAAMVEPAAGELGGVDPSGAKPGIQHTAPIESFPLERWDAILAVDLSSSFHTIRAALPMMRARNWGRIINIASTHGLVASVTKCAYVAAKHGLVGLTKVVALE